MGESADAKITLDVFGPRGAFVTRTTLGGDAPVSLSIGSASNLEVRGDGVLPTHGHVAFIGTTFYAASASSADPIVADGIPVPIVWHALAVPVTLVLGDAFIQVNAVDEREVEPATTKTLKKLPATLKDPYAILARAPNPVALRVPVPPPPQTSSSLIPVTHEATFTDDEPIEVPLRSRIGVVLAAALLSITVIAGYEAHVRWSKRPAPAVVMAVAPSAPLAAIEPPPVVPSLSAAPAPPASSSAPPARKPPKKHRP